MVKEALRNIEIKAQLHTQETFLEKCEIAKKLTGKWAHNLSQHDIVFNKQTGRYTLRNLTVSWLSCTTCSIRFFE